MPAQDAVWGGFARGMGRFCPVHMCLHTRRCMRSFLPCADSNPGRFGSNTISSFYPIHAQVLKMQQTNYLIGFTGVGLFYVIEFLGILRLCIFVSG